MRGQRRANRVISVVLGLLVGACGSQADDATESSAGADESTGPITMILSGTVYNAMGGEEGLVTAFTEETGIEVQVVTAEIPDLYQKQNAAFATGGDTYDVVAFDDSASTPTLWAELAPLNDYIEESGEDYDYEDFISTGRDISVDDEGNIFGIPNRLSAYIVYYRSDILEELGYDEFPTTWDEALAFGEAATTDQRAGLMQRGASPDSGVDFLTYLVSHNGRLLSDDNSTCLLTSPEAVQAAETFVRVFEDFSPRSAVAAGRDDYTAEFQQGRSTMSVFSSSYYHTLVDPEASVLEPEQVGYALTPAANGADVGAARISAWSLGISTGSKHKDAAWSLIRYVTSRDSQLQAALEWGNGPARASVYESDEYIEAFPPAQTVLSALGVAVPDPATPHTAAMRTLLAGQLSEAIAGQKTPAQAMEDACGQIEELLES